jgi:hypothetical protein
VAVPSQSYVSGYQFYTFAFFSIEVWNSFYNVVFFVFHSMAILGQIWGNLISSTVFAVTPDANQTRDMETCGANFDPTLPATNNSNLDRPSDAKVFTM